MKVNRKKLEWFMQNIRRKFEDKECTDKELVEELAMWMERNPSCIKMEGVSDKGRYSYSTVGYGVFSLLGEKYRMGRVEIFDEQEDTGYASDEGTYCMPFIAANQFEDFIEALETDYPIQISIGSVDQCTLAVSEELGIPVDKMNDLETRKQFYHDKNEKWAQETLGISWEEHMKQVLERISERSKALKDESENKNIPKEPES